jgi:Mn-dependent DtxR family transcriptional regulator
MEIRLQQVEKAALIALYNICKGSPRCHVPLEAIQSKFKKDQRHKAKKAIRSLYSLGLINKHPTRGGMTYQLTETGKKYAEEHLAEYLRR